VPLHWSGVALSKNHDRVNARRSPNRNQQRQAGAHDGYDHGRWCLFGLQVTLDPPIRDDPNERNGNEEDVGPILIHEGERDRHDVEER
jgi:hypothetical protein